MVGVYRKFRCFLYKKPGFFALQGFCCCCCCCLTSMKIFVLILLTWRILPGSRFVSVGSAQDIFGRGGSGGGSSGEEREWRCHKPATLGRLQSSKDGRRKGRNRHVETGSVEYRVKEGVHFQRG